MTTNPTTNNTNPNNTNRENISAEAARLLAMTPDQHLIEAAVVVASPASEYKWTNQYLHALTHLAMAQVKQAQASQPTPTAAGQSDATGGA